MISVKQGSIKYQFLSLSYDSTWDWTPVSLTIGEEGAAAVTIVHSFFFFVETIDR